jgi:hypothetical protein
MPTATGQVRIDAAGDLEMMGRITAGRDASSRRPAARPTTGPATPTPMRSFTTTGRAYIGGNTVNLGR